MKKTMALFMALLFCLSFIEVAAEQSVTINVSAAKGTRNVKVAEKVASGWSHGNYLAFANVDLTGVLSIGLRGDSLIPGGGNGDAFQLRLDDVTKGPCLGYIVFDKEEAYGEEFWTNITPKAGIHTLYVVSMYGSNSPITISDVLFSKEEVSPPLVLPTPNIQEDFHDTWQATDALGRKVADFAEAGAVKPGMHQVGMMYWIWTNVYDKHPQIPAEIIAAHPEAKDDYYHEAWDVKGNYFWSKPLFGYYTGGDYFVYRRHAELLNAAGVDAVFIDCSNGASMFTVQLKTMLSAFADARAAGIEAPKVSILSSWASSMDSRVSQLKALWLNIFQDHLYDDLWFTWDGVPMLFGNSTPRVLSEYANTGDTANDALMQEIFDHFIYREAGPRDGGEFQGGDRYWNWLQNYPQTRWNLEEDGRTEFMVAGTGINHSYVFNYEKTGVFSDPYTKGRSYTEAFGEDYRPEAKHVGYFFREQASRVLAEDPAFCMIDGWNEWTAVRNSSYSGFTNAFVDTFDEENSRDFEPSAGNLRDDYYYLLVDFVRRYKGVRPAPVASGEKTIAPDGDLSQWDDVAPEFINLGGGYERDSYGLTDPSTEQRYHYVAKAGNVIRKAKVARDAENFYFLVQCESPIQKKDSFMHLYIDIDRNHATGLHGYDFSVNVAGEGVLAACTDGASWKTLATADMLIRDNSFFVTVPRTLLSETGTADFEFKWADSANETENILNLYEFGSAAPLGRFNYLYTEIEQTALPETLRQALFDTSVFLPGRSAMVVAGAYQSLYEADSRVSGYEANGTLYVPASSLEVIMGDGETKVEYRPDENMLFVRNHNLEDMELTDNVWTYTTVGSYEVRVSGVLQKLSAPCEMKDGIVYVPLSYLAEAFGWEVYCADGTYAVSGSGIDKGAVARAAERLKEGGEAQ